DWADPATYTILDEARDVLALLDHLGLSQAAILGTSRGGLIAMVLAMTARDRLRGVCLNDIGPVIDPAGMADIAAYLGRRPAEKTHAQAAEHRYKTLPGFEDVPYTRWFQEVQTHFIQTDDGLDITYDPCLRDAVLKGDPNAAQFDLWPGFEALIGLPTALIRGVNSNILSHATAQDMARRHPDMIWTEVPKRGHVPFLDEPESTAALIQWMEQLT
ncbi:MAG: alpha/beta hydrolase, partial [Pseudomonadota bacterium]